MDNAVTRFVWLIVAVATLICASVSTFAEDATPVPTQKTVGLAETQIVP